MKKYTYPSVTGEASEIEVTEELAEILAQMDEEEKSIERRETRRHVSIEKFVCEEDLILASSDDVEEEAIGRTTRKTLLETMQRILTTKQYDLIYSIFFLGFSQQEYADMHHLCKSVVAEQKEAALKKLKKFFKTPELFAFFLAKGEGVN